MSGNAINLFQRGDFTLASGQKATWKIECDALTPSDWAGLAAMAVERIALPFACVLGVPRGGLPFAEALTPYIDRDAGTTLVVDDIWTTGGSMERFINAGRIWRPVVRVVAFARNPVPPGVIAVFQMGRVE